MDHEPVFKNPSPAAIYTLPNTIFYLKYLKGNI